jgi:hypothetical protein
VEAGFLREKQPSQRPEIGSPEEEIHSSRHGFDSFREGIGSRRPKAGSPKEKIGSLGAESLSCGKESMRLWSVSTTVRNPERIRSFLKVLKELEGEVWNNETQKKYQILLLQKKAYGINSPEFEKTISQKHIEWLNSEKFTYKQAEEILNAKNYEGGGEMRGRQSFNPIEKMGLAYIDAEKKIRITTFGETFLSENYDIGDIFFRSFLKWQYPNPDLNKYSEKDGYNVKPLIATFHLKIKFVGGGLPPRSSTTRFRYPPRRRSHPRNALGFMRYKKYDKEETA